MKKIALLALPLLTGISLLPAFADDTPQTSLQLGMGCMLARWAFTNNGVLPLDLYRQYLGDISSVCTISGTTISSSDIQITDNSGNLLQRDQSRALIVSTQSLTGSMTNTIESSIVSSGSTTSTTRSSLTANTANIVGGFSLYIDGELVDTTDKALAISKDIYDASYEYGDIEIYRDGLSGENMLDIRDIRSRLAGMQVGQKRVLQLTKSDFVDTSVTEGVYVLELSLTSFR